MKQLISGAEFHNFELQARLICMFKGVCRREQDSEDGEHKAGEPMGYYVETEDGKETIVGNSHSIEKAIGMVDENKKPYVKEGSILGITFLGKGKTNKNQPFNRFDVKLFDTFEEAVTYFQKEALA